MSFCPESGADVIKDYGGLRIDADDVVSLRKSCDGGCGVLRGRRLRHAGRGAWISR